MSQSEPPSTSSDPLADIPASSPQGYVTEIWRNLIPWGDMNAKGVPQRYLEFFREVLPILAIMSMQGDTAPRLLRGNDRGQLYTAQAGTITGTLTEDVAAGVMVLPVTNPDQWAPGQLIAVAPHDVGVNPNPTLFKIQSVDTISLHCYAIGISPAFKQGDVVTLVQPTFALPSWYYPPTVTQRLWGNSGGNALSSDQLNPTAVPQGLGRHSVYRTFVQNRGPVRVFFGGDVDGNGHGIMEGWIDEGESFSTDNFYVNLWGESAGGMVVATIFTL